MVAFRKLMPVFALVALLVSASSAFAQQGTANMQCAVNSGVPPVVRQEGFSELTGDILVTCTGGTQQAPFLANFTVFLNTNITSRLVSGDLSEALLLIDDPGPTNANNPNFCVSPNSASNGMTNGTVSNSNGSLPVVTGGTAPTAPCVTYNAFYGNRATSVSGTQNNSLVWNNIPIVPPGTTGQRVFRFTNIRANATTITTSGFGLPGQIVAYLSVFPPGGLPLNNPQQVVAYAQPGLAFDIRNCAGGSDPVTTIEQCGTGSTSAGRDLFATPTADKTLGSLASFRFREGFSSAFKSRIAPGQQPAANMKPGVTFNTESGYTQSNLLAGTGVADTGTRLAVRFTGVPDTTKIFVSNRNISSGNARAVLVQTDMNGAGGSRFDLVQPIGPGLPTQPTTYVGPRLLCGTKSDTNPEWPATAIQTVNGSGLAVWEIIDPQDGTSPSLAGIVEELIFQYGVAYTFATSTPGAPPPLALTTANVIGNLAPFYDLAKNTDADKMTSGLPIPRFTAAPGPGSQLFKVTACQTNLLFPYIASGYGFDTGMAIANTSEDSGIFDKPENRRQEGKCQISYYGSLTSDPKKLVIQSEGTSRNVKAGETLAWSMTQGSDPAMEWGIKGYQNFIGYAIARCDFRYAHGFAFITDGLIGRGATLAQGYLALVLDGGDSNTLPRGQSSGEVRGQ